MKSNELTLYTILLCVLLIMGWMFAIYAPLRNQVQHAENMVNRKMNRIGSRAALPDMPEVPTKTLQKELEALTGTRDALLDKVSTAEARFVPLDRIDGLRQLRLRIAGLAEEAGLDVKSFGKMGVDDAITDSESAVQNNINARYGRPVIRFHARGSYPQIHDFITRMGAMKQSVAIVHLTLQAPEFDDMIGGDPEKRLLSVQMGFAL